MVNEAAPTTLDGLPLMLTIPEAAAILRVSRTTGYKLAEQWRATGGREGLPVRQFGSRLLVRRADLARLVGVEPDEASSNSNVVSLYPSSRAASDAATPA